MHASFWQQKENLACDSLLQQPPKFPCFPLVLVGVWSPSLTRGSGHLTLPYFRCKQP